MKAILIDITRCTGCEECVDACTNSHRIEPEIPFRKQSRDGLSARKLVSILPTREGRFLKKQCLHCLEPGCVAACPVGAIRKTPEGPVIYDADRCMGCRYCMLSCPLDIPRYEWDQALPYMKKCDMCSDRIVKGDAPACVEICPNGALEFGERPQLLQAAKERIEAHPKRYINHVYGEHELGGTSVLYIGDRSVEALGWPSKVGEKSMLSYTWPIISKTPWVAGGVASLLIGTYAIIKRRMKVTEQEAKSADKDRSELGREGEK